MESDIVYNGKLKLYIGCYLRGNIQEKIFILILINFFMNITS